MVFNFGRKTTGAIFIILISIVCLTSIDAKSKSDRHTPKNYLGEKAMVAAAHPLAVEAGVEILKQDGNAMDAAIATLLTLGVVEPHASGLGGGGFLVYYDSKSNKTWVLDYREPAPAELPKDEYIKDGKILKSKFSLGGFSVGVPAQLKGLEVAYDHYGKIAWDKLVDNAIKHASEGFEVSSTMASILQNNSDKLMNYPSSAAIYLQDEIFPKEAGSMVIQTELANTLRSIQSQKSKAIYSEEPATIIVAAIQDAGGVMTVDDIKNYKPIERDTIHGKYRGYDIITLGAPSTGGFKTIQTLNLLERIEVKNYQPQSPEFLSAFLISQKHAYLSTDLAVADPASANIKTDHLLSEEWINETWNKIYSDTNLKEALENKTAKLETKELVPAVAAESSIGNTTHVSVIDSDGNMAAITNTINSFFGSGIVVPGLGILLNNELKDFTFEVGHLNEPAGGKIPCSSMSPTLLVKDGKPFATLGTPGGRRIPSALAMIIVQLIDFNLSIDEAIEAPRVYFDTSNERISVENRITPETLEKIVNILTKNETYETRIRGAFDKYFGGAQGIIIKKDNDKISIIGGADSRRDGVAQGF